MIKIMPWMGKAKYQEFWLRQLYVPLFVLSMILKIKYVFYRCHIYKERNV